MIEWFRQMGDELRRTENIIPKEYKEQQINIGFETQNKINQVKFIYERWKCFQALSDASHKFTMTSPANESATLFIDKER